MIDIGSRHTGHAGQAGRRAGAVVGGGQLEADEVAEPALEGAGRVVRDHPAVVDHDDPAGERVGLVEVVGGEHDGAAGVGVQASYEVLEVRAVLRVEAGRGLVEEQHLRQVHEPHRDVEAAALPAGERRHRPVRDGGEVEVDDELLGPAPGVRAGQAVGASLADQLVATELSVPGAVALADEADRPTYVALAGHDVVAGHERGARGGWDERGEHPERGRLACSVGAEEGDELALPDLEVEAADGLDGLLARGEVAGQPAGHDRRSGVVVSGHGRTVGTHAVNS